MSDSTNEHFLPNYPNQMKTDAIRKAVLELADDIGEILTEEQLQAKILERQERLKPTKRAKLRPPRNPFKPRPLGPLT